MYNPFVLLDKKLLGAMLRQPMFFVREYYQRGLEENTGTIPLLFTHYSQHDIDKERSQRHYQLINNDPYRFLYDSTDDEHFKKLIKASQQPKDYKIFVNILPKIWQAPHHLRNKIYAYMLGTFPDWEKDKNKKLDIHLQDLFGKLYLVFSWKGNKVEVILDNVEKY